MDGNEVRTLAFVTIVIANLCLILTNRSWSRVMYQTLRTPNRAMGWVYAGTLACLLLVLFVPQLEALFRFAHVPPGGLLLCTGAGAASVLWFEGYKYWNAKTRAGPPS